MALAFKPAQLGRGFGHPLQGGLVQLGQAKPAVPQGQPQLAFAPEVLGIGWGSTPPPGAPMFPGFPMEPEPLQLGQGWGQEPRRWGLWG